MTATKATRLRQALHTRSDELWNQVESLVARATPQLWHTWSTFPSGTKHTPEHTHTVEAIAGQLLSDELIADLTDDEIAVLILACHFHDLGMAGTESDNATLTGQDRVRKEHAISIGERIRARWQELGFEDQNYAEILAEVCRGHRPEKVGGVANWDNLFEYRAVAPDRFVRLRLVSAMIYAADELHLGADRAPKREEEWKEITNVESLRHWRRHQAVTGPAKPVDAICFDVQVNTLSFEKDIRTVFKKAFLAVGDLRHQLQAAGITKEIPSIRLQWLRDALWKLLITKVSSDAVPRTRDEICDLVLREFTNARSDFDQLSDLCAESPPDDTELCVQIQRALSDFATQEYFQQASDPATLQLSSDYRTAKRLLELTGCADTTERLFARAIDATHERQFYESETGRRFIRDHIFSEIKASYAVDIATMPENASLRTVIESSPTACRVVQQIATPPGTLVKTDLLLVAATAGICFDLMSNPDGFLDKPLRIAVRDIFHQTAERLPRFMSFIQELAIIKDLSFDQVQDIVTPSAAECKELDDPDAQRVAIQISQTIPRERPDWAFPYLVLAGRRSEEPITILNSPDAPFCVSTDAKDDAGARLNDNDPISVSIVPGVGSSSRAVTLRASASFDSSRRLLQFDCHKLVPGISDKLPIIVSVPTRTPNDLLNVTFSFVECALCVGQLLDLRRAAELCSAGGLEVELCLHGHGELARAELSGGSPFPIPDLLPLDKLVALVECDRDMFIPYVAPQGMPEQLWDASADAREDVFESVKARLAEGKPTVTSITLRFATAEGVDFREEFLGSLPVGWSFAPPQISGAPMSQDEITQKWEAGEDHWKLTSFFREDAHYLAEELRTWMKDSSQPFPFKIDNDLQFHYCKTRLEREHLPFVDRFWYVERPILLRLGPVTKAEQYRVEMEYWKSLGDMRRADLLEELMIQAEGNQHSEPPDAEQSKDSSTNLPAIVEQ